MEKRLLHAFANFKAKKKKSGVELDQMLVKASEICQEESAPSHELIVAMAENAGSETAAGPYVDGTGAMVLQTRRARRRPRLE